MKQICTWLLCLFLLPSNLNAQLLNNDSDRASSEFYFLQGDQALNLSTGLLNASDFSFDLFKANGSGEPTPSIQLAYEYGLIDKLSIAGFVSYYKVDASTPISYEDLADQISSIDITDFGSIINSLNCIINPSDCGTSIQERVNVFTVGGKLRLNHPLLENLDTYASTYVGYSFNRRKTIVESALQGAIDEVGLETEIPTVVYYGSIGLRFFLTSKIGVWGEYGLGNVHLLNLGVSYRL